jgi:hypothetical protein
MLPEKPGQLKSQTCCLMLLDLYEISSHPREELRQLSAILACHKNFGELVSFKCCQMALGGCRARAGKWTSSNAWLGRYYGRQEWVIVIVCVAPLAIVWSLCLVGCHFQGSSVVINCFDYQQKVLQTSGLVAFWPLDETSGTTATDIGPNNFNGTYTIGPDVPTYDPVNHSDAAPGTFTLGQPNIVAGDCGSVTLTPNPCVAVNGGYVSVPWQAALGPGQSPFQFTLEIWVIAGWTLADAQNNPSNRIVVASNSPTAFQGFSVLASIDNLWAATLGLGSQNILVTTGNNQTIVQNSLYFLVLTYDGNNLTLWVNPADTTQPPNGQVAATGFVPVASQIPLYIGIGHPDLPTPRNPFNGQIQDVAFYNVVLDGTTIETHYLNGSGMQTS